MPDQQQDDHDEQHASERTAREVLPALGVRPEEHQAEQEQKERPEHDLHLCSRSFGHSWVSQVVPFRAFEP
jgi:hypothetical protein